MRRGIAIAIVLSLTVGFFPTGGGSSYLVEYNGTYYPETSEPADRFVHIQPEDVDGDGILDAHHVNVETLEWINASADEVTNSQISWAATLLGVSKSDIKAQLNMLLSEYPQWAAELALAKELIDKDLLKEAEEALRDTPAEVFLYCNGKRVSWVFAIPFPFNCADDTFYGPDIYMVIEIFSVGLRGADLDSIEYIGRTLPAGSGSNQGPIIVGAGYVPYDISTGTALTKEISAGLKSDFLEMTDPGDELNVDFVVSDLSRPSRVSGSVEIFKEISANDALYLTLFGRLGSPTSPLYTLEMGDSTNHLGGNWVVRSGSGKDITIRVTTGHAFLDYLDVYMPSDVSSSTRVEMRIFELPSEVRLKTWKESFAYPYASKTFLQVISADDLYSTEVIFNVIVGGQEFAGADFVGMPTEFQARWDLGSDADNDIKSIDLRRLSTGSGYFRTVVLDTDVDTPVTDIEISDFERLYIFWGDVDIWENDGEGVFSIGINIAKCKSKSGIRGKVTDLAVIQKIDPLKYFPQTCPNNNPYTYKLEGDLGNPPDEQIYFEHDEGSVHMNDLPWGVNLYWWAISDDRVTNAGVCAKKEASGCP